MGKCANAFPPTVARSTPTRNAKRSVQPNHRRHRRSLPAPVPSGRVAALVARVHRTPMVVHWGRNPWLRVRGVRLPQSRMPPPLSLVLHPFHDGFDPSSFELSTFEFLDFDAY